MKRVVPSLGIPLLILVTAYIFDNTLSQRSLEFSETAAHWYALIPPLIAVSIALIFRRILVALFAGVLSGALLIHDFQPVVAIRETAVNYLWENFSNEFSMLFVVFVFALIGMVSLINKGGGTLGVVNLFAKAVKGARSACLTTMAMGLAIFFDDYTNTIIVGSTMRTLTDRMKISREKLAYLVDSTTAPIAGLALISTWIGFEVEQLQHIVGTANLEIGGYGLFLKMLPYRFYCLFTIVFVFAISFFRRDFGPMLKAERRAVESGVVSNPESNTVTTYEFAESHVKEGAPERWYNAAIPIITVIATAFAGILFCGGKVATANGETFSPLSWHCISGAFMNIGQVENAIPIVLAASAIAGSIVAIVLLSSQRILSAKEIAQCWFHGWRIIFVIAGLLVLAWAIRQVTEELGTAYFILAIIHDNIASFWLPLAIFGISSVIAFCTGTSWGTMGILFPIFGPIATVTGNIGFLAISMSAVLDGAIFGDHCSPISDTTILSSLSSNCDHIDHVRTQLPYALVTAVIAGVAGYIPAALGVPLIPTYLMGLVLIGLVIFLLGRKI